MRNKVHFVLTLGDRRGACGYSWGWRENKLELVTCRRCIKVLNARLGKNLQAIIDRQQKLAEL